MHAIEKFYQYKQTVPFLTPAAAWSALRRTAIAYIDMRNALTPRRRSQVSPLSQSHGHDAAAAGAAGRDGRGPTGGWANILLRECINPVLLMYSSTGDSFPE